MLSNDRSSTRKSITAQLHEREVRLKKSFHMQLYSTALKIYETEIQAINFNSMKLEDTNDSQTFVSHLFNDCRVFNILSNLGKTLIETKNEYQEKLNKLYYFLNKISDIKIPNGMDYFYEMTNSVAKECELFFDYERGYYEHYIKYRDIFNKLSHVKLMFQQVSQLIYEDIMLLNPDFEESQNREWKKNYSRQKHVMIKDEIKVVLKKLRHFSETDFLQHLYLKFPSIKESDTIFMNLDEIMGQLRLELIHALKHPAIYKLAEYTTIDSSLSDVIHEFLIKLAIFRPINAHDYISLSEINPYSQICISTGCQFDLPGLIDYHHKRACRGFDLGELPYSKKIIDPGCNNAFSTVDTIYILYMAYKNHFHIDDVKLEDINLTEAAMSGPVMAERIFSTPVLRQRLYKELLLTGEHALIRMMMSHHKTVLMILNDAELYKMLLSLNQTDQVMEVLINLGKRHIDFARSLIHNKKYHEYIAPLHFSITCGHMELIHDQLPHVDIEFEATYYGTPLYVAAQSGNENIVRLIIDRGAQIDKSCVYGTPLYAAAARGNLDIVKLLHHLNADCNVVSPVDKITPLLVSIKNRHQHVSDYLISAGANLHPAAVSKTKYYDIMLSNGYIKEVEDELQNITHTKDLNYAAFSIATMHHYLEHVQYHIQNDNSFNYEFSFTVNRLLKNAIHNKYYNITMALILLLDDPCLAITHILSDYHIQSRMNEKMSVLLNAAKIFSKIVDEINKPILDLSRMNYKTLLIDCLKTNPYLTFAMYFKTLKTQKCPSSLTLHFKKAVDALSLTDIRNKMSEIELEMNLTENQNSADRYKNMAYHSRLFKPSLAIFSACPSHCVNFSGLAANSCSKSSTVTHR